MDKHNRAVLQGILGNVIFGFSYMFTRVILEDLNQFIMLSIRFFIAFAVMSMLLICRVAKFDFSKNIKPLFFLGLLQPVLYFTLESLGISMTSSVVAGSIIAIVPIVSMVLAAVFLKEHFHARQLIFAFVSLSGVILISISGQQSGFRIAGILVMLATVLAATVYSLLNRKISSIYTTFERTYVMFAIGTVVFTSIALFLYRGAYFVQVRNAFSDSKIIISFLYLGLVSSVLAFFMLNNAVNELSVARLTSYANLTSVVSMVAGAIFLGELIRPLHALGSVLILTGVILSNLRFKQT